MKQRVTRKKLATDIRPSDTRPKTMPCINRDCKLRVKGCMGFEGCPGYKTIAKE
ncbi:MAG: hypothetical protein HQL06_00050 [Nitrospirae bacterium]|nr:hypothetical protein [Nitrospirota bacterium]